MSTQMTNGLDTGALKGMIDEVSRDAAKGKVRFQVGTSWKGGTRSETRIDGWELAGQKIPKNFTLTIDEPKELLGGNTAPNPQEMLMASFNACMLVGYVAGCAMKGIELEKLEIRTHGELDLRGFLGIDASVKPGYDEIYYTVHIKGKGTKEQFQEVHETVAATSPNRWNVANPIKLRSELVVE
jgi:uncharacterized OsmC-like protein